MGRKDGIRCLIRAVSEQEALYLQCRRFEGARTIPISSAFDENSLPYLWATEHPWQVISSSDVNGKMVLTVAGGGDLPIFFQGHGAAKVVAVDISKPSCYTNELKRAALTLFSWKDFMAFFLGGICWLAEWLNERGISVEMVRSKRLDLYRYCRPLLSKPARTYWDKIIVADIARENKNPFASLVRPTDLLTLDHIPMLRTEAAYELCRQRCSAYPLIPLSFTDALVYLRENFDFIYCSNILEYLRADFMLSSDITSYRQSLDDFFRTVTRFLKPGGTLYFYLFLRVGCQGYSEAYDDFAFFRQSGFLVEEHEVRCPSAIFPGTNLHHTLLAVKKTCT